MVLIKFLFLLALGIVVLYIMLFFWTNSVQRQPEQQLFLSAKYPQSLPQGFYSGSIKGVKTSWRGKKFDSAHAKGINVFTKNAETREAYPFKTYKAHGLTDTKVAVLKIDYNTSENPFWLRFILDEIREVKTGEYLGKIHLRLLPGVSFTLGYFTLRK